MRDQVILGCADHDIKLDCLIEKGPSTPLEEVEAFVEGKESGKISLQQLSEGSEAAAPISSFRKLLSKLGLTERYLSKTRLQMSAANVNNLDIIGAIALRLSYSASPSGTETRQIVYICRDKSDFFLSRGACVALGIVPRNFPGL